MSNTFDRVFAIIKDRQAHPREGSYTNRLLDEGEDRILQKVGEEAVELLLAAKGQGRERLISEVADLTYHCLVMLAHFDLSPGDIAAELERRFRDD